MLKSFCTYVPIVVGFAFADVAPIESIISALLGVANAANKHLDR